MTLRVAVAGLGTVGAGVVDVLRRNADLVSARSGRLIEVTDVSARDRHKDRGVDVSGCRWHDDPVEMARSADVDVVVELIGGADGPAKAVCETAIGAGRHVVTANKALLAAHGAGLAAQAEGAGVNLAWEAAVAGGIPVIKTLREGLAGNRISGVHGILNGTCNFILTEMRDTGRGFDEVLEEAQRLGYAEADPTFDVDGIDAAHKLALLTSLAFGVEISADEMPVEGIRHVSSTDIEYAEEFGYRIKLLGIARRTPDGIEQRVHPAMVPVTAPIARIDGVTNAVVLDGDAIGSTALVGPGAGAGPTASAVVADLVDVATRRNALTFGIPAEHLQRLERADPERHYGASYLRLMVIDRPGVFAAVARVLGEHGISIESVVQRGRDPQEVVPVVMITHDTDEGSMKRAIAAIERIEEVVEPARMIRIESL